MARIISTMYLLVRDLAAVNFEQFRVGCQICDLYQFIRKIMEKHNWNQELGMRLIREYNRVQNMSKKKK